MDSKKSTYQTAIDQGAFDDHVEALFQNPDGLGWQLVEYEIGATDARGASFYAKKYGAPASIFPKDAPELR